MRWMCPSFVPTIITSTASSSFGSNGRNNASSDDLEQNTSSLYLISAENKRGVATYEVPPVRTLSFGKLVSISIRVRSRGKSITGLLSNTSDSSPRRSSHDSSPFLELTDLRFLLVKLSAQSMHVTPEICSPVEN